MTAGPVIRRAASVAVRSVAAAAVAIWIGGKVALGAVAAPAVFGIVPAPWSGDAMTVVFRRFDGIALGCAVVVVACELVFVLGLRGRDRASAKPAVAPADGARVVCVLGAAACAAFVALSVSPRIEALHRMGALRGVGELGRELERAHHLAVRSGYVEIVALLAYLVLMNAEPSRSSNPCRHLDDPAPSGNRSG